MDDPADLDELIALRAMTDPVARDAAHAISLLAAEDRYVGRHAAVVMAPFLRLGASRFSPGTFGVLYVADTLETAVRESAYHAGRLLKASGAPPTHVPRVGVALEMMDENHADIRRTIAAVDEAVYDPDDYGAAQRVGSELRSAGHDGVRYDSVRRTGGICYGVFRPRCVRTVADEGCDLLFAWTGSQIESYSIVKTYYL